MPTKLNKIEKKQALRELWNRGVLDYKRRDNQKLIRDFIKNDTRDIITVLASRRQGKSYELILQAVELCMTKPNAIVKYICPRLKMVKTIVMPNMRLIMEDCPLDMKPEWKENDKMYIFPNGSQIQFAGTDNGSHENLRGGCLSARTLIMTTKGPMSIKDIIPGDFVFGYNKDGSVSRTKVTKVFRNGMKKVTDLITFGKRTIACTDDHKWLVSRNNEKMEVAFKDMDPKDVFIVTGHNENSVVHEGQPGNLVSFKKGRTTLAFTYDLQVDNDTSLYLTAGGLVTHNSSDMCIVDEAGFCDHLEYVVNSILAPTTDTTDGKVVLISTPSKTPNHDFILKFVRPSLALNKLLKLTIYDNPTMSEDKVIQIASRFPSGMDDPQFKREYLCDIVSDDDSIVIPEFSKNKEKIIREWARPRFFNTYTSGDVGFKDLTAYLFAYWDFANATLVIEDELAMNGPEMTTENLAKKIREKEKLNFHDTSGEALPTYLRVMDNNLIMVNDLNRLHNLNFIATAKDNKEAQINQVRMMFANNQIVINPRCKHLIYHLDNAAWDKHHKQFTRLPDTPDFSIKGGHADFCDSIIYLVRNLVRSKNPYPKNWGANTSDTSFQSLHVKEDESGMTSVIKKMFNIKS